MKLYYTLSENELKWFSSKREAKKQIAQWNREHKQGMKAFLHSGHIFDADIVLRKKPMIEFLNTIDEKRILSISDEVEFIRSR